MKRVSIFADVQNIYYTTKQIYNANFDYNGFWRRVTEGREVVKAIAYAVDRNDIKQKQFQNILRGIGFDVRLKPYLQRSDGTTKGDWDVGITVDIMEYAPETDIVVLASGDGDFDVLVNKIRNKYGVEVEVYGVRELTSLSLMNAASAYIPIKDDLLLKKDTR